MEKSERTKQFIIEKAAAIFNMYGYAGTSISQLTKEIGMTKGAIYGNFKDKDEIALASFDYNFSKISKIIAQVLHAKNDANDKLIAFANFYLDNFSEISKFGGCPLLNATVDSDFAHPVLKKRVAQAVEAWIESISGIIYSGIKKEQIKKNIKPEQFASVFASLIEGGLLLSKATGSTIQLSRNIDHIIHLVNIELRV
jgi:AcrR family transcriptional regulator